jgi:hypothetical protein
MSTKKMLKKYARGAGLDYEQVKHWWNRLSAPTRQRMSKRIREAIREGEDREPSR